MIKVQEDIYIYNNLEIEKKSLKERSINNSIRILNLTFIITCKGLHKTRDEGQRLRASNREAFGIDYQFGLRAEVAAKVHLRRRKWSLDDTNRYLVIRISKVRRYFYANCANFLTWERISFIIEINLYSLNLYEIIDTCIIICIIIIISTLIGG